MKARVTVIREIVSTYRNSGLTKEELFNPTAETYAKMSKAEKIDVHSWYHEVQTGNDILIVFSLAAPGDLSIGDELEIDLERIDLVQDVRNQTTGKAMSIEIAKNNIHDLRLPMRHGGSRFSSPERRAGA